MNYRDKLKDPRWQKKRLEVLNRYSFTCCHCGDDKTQLHIHHLKYNGEPWEADMADMITVCAHCHVIQEKLNKTYPGSTVVKVMRRDTMDAETGTIENRILSRFIYFKYILPGSPVQTKGVDVIMFCSIIGYEYVFESMIALKALKEFVELCEKYKLNQDIKLTKDAE